MTEKLFFNASANLVGYIIIGTLNLVLAGLIIRNWGLDGYGIFILIRLLTPIGYFNILDFGMFESTVRNIAKYRSSCTEINRVFSLTASYFICVGIFTSALMFLFGKYPIEFLNLNTSLEMDLDAILSLEQLLILVQIPLFIMIFLESVLKGYEKFLLLRIADLLVVISCLVLLIFRSSIDISLFSFIVVYYSVLGLKLALLLIFVSKTNLNIRKIGFPSISIQRDIFRHSSTMGVGKLISTSIEYLPLVGLSNFASVEVAGAYDAIMRIPKFLKSLMGNINSVIVPYAASLTKVDFDESKAILINSATKYQSMLFAPVLILGLVFSEDILNFWIGSSYSTYSNSMKLCFVVPLLILFIGAASSVSVSDQSVIKSLNYINAIRMISYVGVGLLLMQANTLEAFIYANIISYSCTEVLVLKLFRKRLGVSILDLTKPVLSSVFVSAIVLVFGHELLKLRDEVNPFLDLFVAGVCLAVIATIFYIFGLSDVEKRKLQALIKDRTPYGG